MKFDQVFEESMDLLQAMFGASLSKVVIKVYHGRLKDNLTVEELKAACRWLSDNWKPTASLKFPVIADFIKNSGKISEDDRAQKAIEAVRKAVSKVGSYKSVSFGDSALHRTIKASAGCWPSICQWTDEQWKYNEKKFKEMYLSQLRAGGVETLHLGGHHETDPLGVVKIEYVPVLPTDPKPKLEAPKKFTKKLIERVK